MPVLQKSGPAQLKKSCQSNSARSKQDVQDHVQKYRELRKQKEEEQLKKQRELRLQRTLHALSTTSTSFRALPTSRTNRSTATVSRAADDLAGLKRTKTDSKLLKPALKLQGPKAPTKPGTSTCCSRRSIATAPKFTARPSGMKRSKPDSELLKRASKSQDPKAPTTRPSKQTTFCSTSIPLKRKSSGGLKKKSAPTVANSKAIRHTKASQLRLLHGNSSIEVAHYSIQQKLTAPSSIKDLFDNATTRDLPFLKKMKKMVTSKSESPLVIPSTSKESNANVEHTKVSVGVQVQSSKPSKIPVKRTSFASPMTSPARTPKPASLREKLLEWLKTQGRSLEDFKHLDCFGISSSAVKRPKTPHRIKVLSNSILQAIPESKENSPEVGTPEADSGEVLDLDTTYTLEEEDKENILCDPVDIPKKTSATSSEAGNSLDKAQGVLADLLKLLKMGYPTDQCELWLRAVRRRFPQCGDEAVYWECLAAIGQARGDLKTALSCYERAVSQGGEESIQASLDELRHKLTELNITTCQADVVSESCSRRQDGLDTSNIIQSSSIQFFVKEKGTSKTTPEFTATPVRRSTRNTSAQFHQSSTVQSLDALGPKVRKSLLFQNNTALDDQL